MAKYYLLPKHLMDRLPAAQTPVWLLEAAVFHLLYGLARLMPLPLATRVFAACLGVVGRRNSNKLRPVRRNLAVMMPEASEAGSDAGDLPPRPPLFERTLLTLL